MSKLAAASGQQKEVRTPNSATAGQLNLCSLFHGTVFTEYF